MKKNEKEIQDLIDLLPSQGLKSYVLRNYGFLYQVKVFDWGWNLQKQCVENTEFCYVKTMIHCWNEKKVKTCLKHLD